MLFQLAYLSMFIVIVTCLIFSFCKLSFNPGLGKAAPLSKRHFAYPKAFRELSSKPNKLNDAILYETIKHSLSFLGLFHILQNGF